MIHDLHSVVVLPNLHHSSSTRGSRNLTARYRSTNPRRRALESVTVAQAPGGRLMCCTVSCVAFFDCFKMHFTRLRCAADLSRKFREPRVRISRTAVKNDFCSCQCRHVSSHQLLGAFARVETYLLRARTEAASLPWRSRYRGGMSILCRPPISTQP